LFSPLLGPSDVDVDDTPVVQVVWVIGVVVIAGFDVEVPVEFWLDVVWATEDAVAAELVIGFGVPVELPPTTPHVPLGTHMQKRFGPDGVVEEGSFVVVVKSLFVVVFAVAFFVVSSVGSGVVASVGC
jgi:hypothetical protein